MNIFTVNQATQVYVLKSNSDVIDLSANADITKRNNLGSIGFGSNNGKVYFKHLGAGGVTRSDIIDKNNFLGVTYTPANKMNRTLNAAKITLNSEALDENSKPIVGQDYILRLKFQNPVGMSPDNQYWKYGAVHVVKDDTASDFYVKMAKSIVQNMSREATQLIKVYVTSTAESVVTETEVTPTATLSGTYDGIVVREAEQDWILGVKQQKPLIFTAEATTIVSGASEVVWGDVVYVNGQKTTGGADPSTSVVSTGLPDVLTLINSKLAADFEYFFMGERGDQYRMNGWPNYVPTTYLVDPTYQYGYDIITIHYAYTGANHAVQKSEKDIAIVVPSNSGASGLGTKAAAIKAKIDALFGLS